MTVERGNSDGVRLHVGGLPRGVGSNELAALIAAALPAGTSPSAEIMRDASTGIERGFGYVNIPAGEGVKVGAERAIAAYNGSRWKGKKIRVGLAKGDYLQRLKVEWEEAAKEKEAALAAATSKVPAVVPYKARPFLRLRRRPGDRVILVDPTPVAVTRNDGQARTWDKRKGEKEAKTTDKLAQGGKLQAGQGQGQGQGREQGREESGAHVRKRGVLGGTRKVDFPGGEASRSVKCRDLWRRHLQERRTEARAESRRSVARLLLVEEAAAASTTAMYDPNDRTAPPSLIGAGDGEPAAMDCLQHEGATDLPAEEPPPAEDIEFVWDDPSARDSNGSGSDGVEEEEEDDSVNVQIGDQAKHQDGGPAQRQGVLGPQGRADQKEAEGNEVYELPAVDHTARLRGVDGIVSAPPPPRASSTRDSAATGRRALKKLEKLGKNHGLELDDRLAELLSEGSDDVEDDAYDYELATAEASTAVTSKAIGATTMGSVREELQAETERSLGVLAELFGGDGISARPAAGGSSASSSCFNSGREAESGVVRVEEGPEASALPEPADVSEEGGSGGRPPKPPKQQQQRQQEEQQQEGGQGQGHEDAASCGVGVGTGQNEIEAPMEKEREDRFVTRMAALTDIFKVQDKVSTKKNKVEKEKDKGFKVTSLFDDLGTMTLSAAEEKAHECGGGGFSFAFGSEKTASSSAAFPSAGELGVNAASVETGRPDAVPASDSIPPVHGGVNGSNTATPLSTVPASASDHPQPALTPPPSAASAPDVSQTALWRSLDDVVAVAARFVRVGKRQDVEATWLGERRSLTQDFKRKHKDAVKGRRGPGGRGSTAASRKRSRW